MTRICSNPRTSALLLGLALALVAGPALANGQEKPPGPVQLGNSKPHEPQTRPAGAAQRPADEKAAAAKTRVDFEIVQGEDVWGHVVIELEDQKAPITVRNFLRYVREGFYDGTIFHRVITGAQYNNIVQGGGYVSFTEKKEGVHEPIICEASRSGVKNQRGTIAMARISSPTSLPNSATSQFFINLTDNADLDHPGTDNTGYCAFGRVVEGMEVVDKFKDLIRRSNPAKLDERSQPTVMVTLKHARILDPSEAAGAAPPASPTTKPAPPPTEPPSGETPSEDSPSEAPKSSPPGAGDE